jgi:peptidyl-prolyl cis-trans isomerase D
VKVSNVEKSGQGITSTEAANRVCKKFLWLLLTTEFEKLGLRVGEKHLLEVLKADQNIEEIHYFKCCVFDVEFKEYFKQTLLKLNSKDRERMPT